MVAEGRFSGFEWDEGNRTKCQKHGVSLPEIEGLFLDGELHVAPDVAHSTQESRFLAIGRAGSRHVFLAFTIRERGGKRFIRPISARYIHRKEIESYEKAHPTV